MLKNQGLLPLKEAEQKKIVILGKFAGANAHGSGAANAAGYETVTLSKAFIAEFGNNARLIHTGDERSIREADLVVLSVGTLDSEAVDRSFDLPKDQENLINWVLRVEQEYPYSDQFRRGNKYEPLDR
ncbi:glycoside hydrolase family 3 C-terminal domain-containing protein [Marispirochaeta aestuarii]|uniref:glycoside hydrolase family 3 C-terminal domain-containing protein n=1 Tax=Marispirochaeta aestuarii TaxID=1963862 RepID=UPI0029C81A5B|nr:glycoside hydrolase family 3 C-terminal domain-containing protein [Marispirochaeta aestuarii]